MDMICIKPMNSWQPGGLLKNKFMERIPIILHCTENYLPNSLVVVNSLNLYHENLDFYLYTLNFKYESDIPNLNTIYIEDPEIESNISFVGNQNDVGNKNMFKSVFFKSKVVLHTIETLKIERAIYIDSDMVPTGDISELFKYFDILEDYPLIQRSLFEYQINYNRGNPFHKGGFDETNILEYPLMSKHHVPTENRTPYSVTSVMIYNKECKQLFREYDWMNKFAVSMGIDDLKYYYPFSDETVMNVLLWKYKFNKRLPFMQMNIDHIDNIREFYESNYDTEREISSYVRVPSKDDRKNILFFHGAKGDLSNGILSLQKNSFSSRLDYVGNIYHLTPNINYNRELEVVFYDEDKIIYSSAIHAEGGIGYWFSANRRFNTVNRLTVKIFDDGRLIYIDKRY